MTTQSTICFVTFQQKSFRNKNLIEHGTKTIKKLNVFA